MSAVEDEAATPVPKNDPSGPPQVVALTPVPLLAPAALAAVVLAPFLLRATFAASTNEALIWVGCSVVAAVVTGSLLAWSGVRHGLELGLFTWAAFAPVAALGVLLLAGLPGRALVGCAAAVLAVPVATVIGARLTAGLEGFDSTRGIAVGAGLVALFVTALLVTGAGPRLSDQQDKLADAERLEASGLRPLSMEIEGYDAQGLRSISQAGEETSYTLSFESPGTATLADTVSVEVRRVSTNPCEEYPDSYTCEDRDGYTVALRNGQPDTVLSSAAGMELEASLSEGDADDVDRIGAGMAAAEQSSWNDVLGIW